MESGESRIRAKESLKTTISYNSQITNVNEKLGVKKLNSSSSGKENVSNFERNKR
jgi:hypothetical protein